MSLFLNSKKKINKYGRDACILNVKCLSSKDINIGVYCKNFMRVNDEGVWGEDLYHKVLKINSGVNK